MGAVDGLDPENIIEDADNQANYLSVVTEKTAETPSDSAPKNTAAAKFDDLGVDDDTASVASNMMKIRKISK